MEVDLAGYRVFNSLLRRERGLLRLEILPGASSVVADVMTMAQSQSRQPRLPWSNS